MAWPTYADAADGLNELLSESRADAAARAAARFTFERDDALALYGAGQLGRHVLARLRSAGVEPTAFADDTPSKQGTELDGLFVVSPSEFAARYGYRAIFAVTIFNPAASFLRISSSLRGRNGARAVSFLELAWKYPRALLPHYQFELPQEVLAKAALIRQAFGLFADEESRREFVAHLRFRLHLDFEALPPSNLGDYFPEGVIPELPSDVTFVDCGAFDGDTVRRFVERQHGRFGEVYAFEPDAENFRRLSEYAATLGDEARRRVHLFHAAVGARRGRLRFDSNAGMASALSKSGNEVVDVLAIGEVVFTRGTEPLFLKFDVEGAEADALEGAAELIALPHTYTAVCVYHRPDDLWSLPLRLNKLAPNHRLYLRTQGEDGMDVVCYAVPKS
jgi:FkbM family methyltransferase